jgi:hypothetical protein
MWQSAGTRGGEHREPWQQGLCTIARVTAELVIAQLELLNSGAELFNEWCCSKAQCEPTAPCLMRARCMALLAMQPAVAFGVARVRFCLPDSSAASLSALRALQSEVQSASCCVPCTIGAELGGGSCCCMQCLRGVPRLGCSTGRAFSWCRAAWMQSSRLCTCCNKLPSSELFVHDH